MKSIKLKIAIVSIIFLTLQTGLFAQQIATATMDVTVEVVAGSTVEMNNQEWITFHHGNDEAAFYAMFTIRHQEESVILTSSSDSVTLINGADQFELHSIMTENITESGDIELYFTGTVSEDVNSGKYSGRQVAEIIYL